MPTPASVVLNFDGSAWFSGPPDPTTFQQLSATHIFIWDGAQWVEATGIFVWDGSFWQSVSIPDYPTLTASNGTFCVGFTPHYQVDATVTNIPAGAVWEVRGFRSTNGNTGFVPGTPQFTVAEGDTGLCWGYYQIRVKSNYSDWSPWSGDSTHIHVTFNSCGRPV